MDLGLPLEGWKELDSIEPQNRNEMEVLHVRLRLLIDMKEWRQATELAETAVSLYPGMPDFYILGAFASRRFDSVLAARRFLVGGQKVMEDCAVFYYNMACYDCLLGDTDGAKELLAQSFALDKGFRKLAKEDEDLKPLWPVLSKIRISRKKKEGEGSSKGERTKTVVVEKPLSKMTKDEIRAEILRCTVHRDEPNLIPILKYRDSHLVQLAVDAMWQCWLSEKGPEAQKYLDEGSTHLASQEFQPAEMIFNDLMQQYPDWAEPMNKLATLYYLSDQTKESLELAEKVVEIKPHHFGAWNGIAVCAVKLQQWEVAKNALIRCIELVPSSQQNHDMLTFVEQQIISGQ